MKNEAAGRVVLIVLSVLHTPEDNENRMVKSRVNAIILKCLETPVKHKSRVQK